MIVHLFLDRDDLLRSKRNKNPDFVEITDFDFGINQQIQRAAYVVFVGINGEVNVLKDKR